MVLSGFLSETIVGHIMGRVDIKIYSCIGENSGCLKETATTAIPGGRMHSTNLVARGLIGRNFPTSVTLLLVLRIIIIATSIVNVPRLGHI